MMVNSVNEINEENMAYKKEVDQRPRGQRSGLKHRLITLGRQSAANSQVRRNW